MLIVNTFVGEIVLLDRVCRGHELETADQNLVGDSYSYYYIRYVIYGHGMSCMFNAFDV